MTDLPRGFEQAFEVAAAELGMYSAARLILRVLSEQGGQELIEQARDRLGRPYPVFDVVAARWNQGERGRAVRVEPVVRALEGARRLLVVGLEAEHLDALVPRLQGLEVGLLTESVGLEPDWRRVLANYEGALRPVGLSELPHWAGRWSALLVFVYGSNGHVAIVPPPWLRVLGPDVRTQYRDLIGWDILGSAMEAYPRWLFESSIEGFSRMIHAEAG